MQLKPEQLSLQLKKQLAPLYFIQSDEPLHHQEQSLLIQKKAYSIGFTETQRFTLDSSFDWKPLTNATGHLFSKPLFILQLPHGKPGSQAKPLQTFIENNSPEQCVIILSPKLNKQTEKTAWFKAIATQGITITNWPINRHQFPNWLKQRLKQQGLSIDAEGLSLLTEYTEGNLLAASQEIEKLKLLYGETHLTRQSIHEAMASSAHYTLFNLVDACLECNQSRTLSILQTLQEKEETPLLILWALTQYLRKLIRLTVGMQQGENFSDLCRKQLIRYHQAHYKQRIEQGSLTIWYALLTKAARIDLCCKGLIDGDPWDLLLALCIALTVRKQ